MSALLLLTTTASAYLLTGTTLQPPPLRIDSRISASLSRPSPQRAARHSPAVANIFYSSEEPPKKPPGDPPDPKKPTRKLNPALKLFLAVWSAGINASAVLVGMGMLLNFSGFGYKIVSLDPRHFEVEVKPLSEMRRANAEKRFFEPGGAWENIFPELPSGE